MKAFIVLALCIAACAAAPNGYGHVRLLTTTSAPLVFKNTYATATYEQPAEIRVVKKEIPIVRYTLDSDNQGTYTLEALSADQSSFNQEGNLRNLGDEEGPVQVMKGSYSYIGDDSKTYTITYVADEHGFRAEGAHIPTPHPEIQQALMMMGPGSD